MPQYAMAQAGSCAAIRLNWRCASSYQKSCRRATPRLKGARTAAEQDTAKLTVPSFSSGSIARLASVGAPTGGEADESKASATAPSGDQDASAKATKHRVKYFMVIPL